MSSARVLVAVCGALALGYGAVWSPPRPAAHLLGAVTAGLVLVALAAWWPRLRGFAAAGALVAASGSLAATWLVRDAFPGGRAEPAAATSVWVFAEAAALTVLVYLAVRWARSAAGMAVAVAPALAAALLWQRFGLGGGLSGAAMVSAVWLLPGAGAAITAGYLRFLAAARGRAVAEARRRQRLDLANDLHDFVAHDISEIIAQAQAGRIVFADGRPELAALLERIETAGVRALGSMDRTLALLHDPGEASRNPVGGVDDLATLVARFNDGDGPRAELALRLDAPVPREAGAVVHRAVTEALTNVRRHAPTATVVAVSLSEADGMLVLAVEDDGRGAPARPRTSSGLGLAGMAERAEGLGGRLTAGPREPAGWRTELRLPLQPNPKEAPL
ncbi:sensor histidine kinase [Glycomyces albidus]|uniref:histidine kinase n=1 Tax=Glycomyces albidus TaxID=2656774 RepID=A0A6L5G7D6_9ACTN|nr:ATP-binding protein [Glycomyces albidus]MQM25570.1 two-component sensor histidine kinase [Glycomyces albidus]